MSNKDSGGSLARRKKWRNTAVSALGFGSLALSASVYGGSITDAIKNWIKVPDNNVLIAHAHPDFRESFERAGLVEKYARDATEQLLSDPEHMEQYMKEVWDEEIDDPTKEQCLVCSKAAEIEDIVYETAERLGRDPYIELAQIWEESRFNQNAVSSKRARGDKQIKWVACKEVYNLMKNLEKERPEKRFRGYIESKGDVLALYKDMYPNLKEVKKRFMNHANNRRFNIITGIIFSDYLDHENGNERGDGLAAYLNGNTDFKRNPEKTRKKSKKYVKDIMKNAGVFKRCYKLRSDMYNNNLEVLYAQNLS